MINDVKQGPQSGTSESWPREKKMLKRESLSILHIFLTASALSTAED